MENKTIFEGNKNGKKKQKKKYKKMNELHKKRIMSKKI